jgi:hypothetical protein
MAPIHGPSSGQDEDQAAQAARQPEEPSVEQPQAPAPANVQNESIRRAEEYHRTGAQQDQAQTDDNRQTQGYYDSSEDPDQDEADYEELEASEPPPQLPQYDQPPAPEPDSIWTPGYWAYAPAGYYWVPGVWVVAPWPGALWTPGYWVFYGGHYRFHHGYWGRYIGFYGGINYGWGYPGYGFYGGYWRGSHFFYNRAVTHININRIRNVYSRPVIINRTYINNTRVSYNGGRGGLQVRPRPAELAALREPRLAPMKTQLQVRQQAAQNRQQFYRANRGRPVTFAAAHPVQADQGVQRPLATPMQGRPGQYQPRPGQYQNRPNTLQVRPAQPQQPQVRPGQPYVPPSRPEVRPGEPGRQQIQPVRPKPNVRPTQPQVRPTPPEGSLQYHRGRPDVQPVRPNPQPAPGPRQMQGRPAPIERPTQQPQYRQEYRPQYRPAPQQYPRPEYHQPPMQRSPQPMPQHAAPQPQPGGHRR